MNLFRFAGLLGGLAGMLSLALFGYARAGFIGAAIGGVLGFVAGFVCGAGTVGAYFWTGILLERRDKRRTLGPVFGPYFSAARREAWLRAKARLEPGSKVRGPVEAVKRYGFFLDIGCGFPAYLARYSMDGSEPDSPGREPMEAWVLDFEDSDREVNVTRTPPQWLFHDGTPIGYFVDDKPPTHRGERTYLAYEAEATTSFLKEIEAGRTIPCAIGTREASIPADVSGAENRLSSCCVMVWPEEASGAPAAAPAEPAGESKEPVQTPAGRSSDPSDLPLWKGEPLVPPPGLELTEEDRAVCLRAIRDISGKWPGTFPDVLTDWPELVSLIEKEGYEGIIEEYESELDAREIYEDLLKELPAALRRKISTWLENWDDRFRAATVPRRRSLLDRLTGGSGPWWMDRVPAKRGPMLEDDLAG